MNEETKSHLFKICKSYEDVLIIDVMNYLHRFMWVHKDLQSTVDGEVVSTGHIYGFTRFLTFLRNRFPNCSLILALDGLDESRRELNPLYKAQRAHTYRVDKEMDEIVYLCGLVGGVYVGYQSDMEADDVIHSVSKKINELCLKNNIQKNIFILSNDKDMFQCVTDTSPSSIKIIRKFGSGSRWFADSEVIGVAEVREKFSGVSPANLAKFRAIVGDASDNLKGYYRFRKSNASVLAENCAVGEAGLEFQGVDPIPAKWQEWQKIINEQYHIFWSNYHVMKLKEFDFDLESVGGSDVGSAVSLVSKYQLSEFKTWLCTKSPHKQEIAKIFFDY